ncbi:MAG: ATP-binding protein [Stenomitos frigidus ULC029]
MSQPTSNVLALQKAQGRVELMAQNAEALLLEPELLATVLEELTVVLEEIDQQYDELLSTRQALEEERQRYQELFDFAPDGYLVTDVQGTIQKANQAAGSLFNVPPGFLTGKPLTLFVAKNDRRAFYTYLTALRTAAQPRNWDLHLQPRDGAIFPAVIATSAVRSRDGTLMGWRWLLRDLTELRRAGVVTRASAIETKLDHLRSSFIQMISHELRTPMTIILTALELLKHNNTASETKKQAYFDRIQQATHRMNTLLNDVLLYNDTEASSGALTLTPLDLEAFCRATVSNQQATEGNRHTITISSNGACKAVWVDQELVQQMLDRLLSNALKYSPTGTTVQVVLQCQSDRTVISIHNKGTPFSEEQQAHLFEPFYRPAATEHIPGTGLGLVIAKRAVTAHGGTLTVESNTAGITFKIVLPRVEGRG